MPAVRRMFRLFVSQTLTSQVADGTAGRSPPFYVPVHTLDLIFYFEGCLLLLDVQVLHQLVLRLRVVFKEYRPIRSELTFQIAHFVALILAFTDQLAGDPVEEQLAEAESTGLRPTEIGRRHFHSRRITGFHQILTPSAPSDPFAGRRTPAISSV